jgi:hypothetical protein
MVANSRAPRGTHSRYWRCADRVDSKAANGVAVNELGESLSVNRG